MPNESGSLPETSASKIGSVPFSKLFPLVTSALDEATTHSANLPPKSDLSFHRTLDRKFGKELDLTSERILSLAEKLLKVVSAGSATKTSNGGARPKQRRKLEDEDDVMDGYRGAVVDVVDSLLEDADSCLDELNGQKKAAAISVKPGLAAEARKKMPGPFSESARLDHNLYHASSIAKPQKLFPDAIDNSRIRGWSPSLKEKAHAMVPLDFVLPEQEPFIYDPNDDEDAIRQKRLQRERDTKARHHPYYYETKHLPYPTSMFTSDSPISPKSFDETPFVFVDTKETYYEMVEQLKAASEIAVDLEHHSMRSYDGFTCLMQISTRDGDWVVDTLALRGVLREDKLGGVLVDPSKVKVFHGADSDILWLQRDFDIYVVNLFDTYHATKVLDFPSFSLASLLSLYCDFQADKRYQMADWRIRPLPKEMLFYARSDTHFLLFIYDNLRNALLERSSRAPTPTPSSEESVPKLEGRRNPQQAMRDVLDRSAETALKLYERDGYDEVDGKGTGGWRVLARKLGSKEVMVEEIGWVFKRLHAWRDNLARNLDESTHYVLPNQLLVSLSIARPQTIPVLLRAIGGRASIAAKHAGEVLKAIKDGKVDYLTYQKKVVQESLSPVGTTPADANVASSIATTSRAGPAITPKPSTRVVDDVWSNLSTPKPQSTQRKAQSSMFGSSIKFISKDIDTTPKPKKVTSSLFGTSLSSKAKDVPLPSRERSPGFENVQKSIHQALLPLVPSPAPPSSAPTTDVTTTKKEVHSTAVPEQVPFVASSSRTTIPPAQTPTPKAPVVEKEKDAIVNVKKSKRQKRKEPVVAGDVKDPVPSPTGSAEKKRKVDIGPEKSNPIPVSNPTPTAAAPTKRNRRNNVSQPGASAATVPEEPTTASTSSSTSTTATSTPVPDVSAAIPKKQRKKNKILPSQIPIFDYSKESNLLDDPKLAKAKGEAGKEKKARKPKVVKAPVIDTSLFRKPPMDPSQPKAGNKSGTF